MKKKIILLIGMFSIVLSCIQAQNQESENALSQNSNAVAYRLFPTQNTWTFIKLDTRNGRMWKVQWSTESDKRFESFLSLKYLVPKEDEINDRFTLYSTQNIYNFILLDQFDGRMWQVQWHIDPEKRFIVPIE
jgi:hypothetical protein